MGKNTKPMLTVLVEGDKLQQFRDYALSKEVSMGWVVNRLLDRVLSGELDVMGDTVSTGTTKEYTSTGLTREAVETMIKSSLLNLNIPSIDSSAIEELARVSIETAIEPIKESVSELETYARSQFAAIRVELKAISDRAVEPTADSIVKSPTSPRKAKPTQGTYPEWVTKDDKPFYNKLVDNPELLDKVAEAIAIAPNSTALAESLVGLGFHKQDGTPLASTPVSRIKKVVRELKAKPESTLPLFPQ
jgi:hypothetical protein